MDPVSECRRRSLEVLAAAAGPDGFVASAGYDHYASVWARDGAIACLGANRSGDDVLTAAARRTLETLAGRQSEHGQIPNAVWPTTGAWDWGEAGCTDASAWFIVAVIDHQRHAGGDLVDKLRPNLEAAADWLVRQDCNGLGLVDSPAAGDWMDSSLMRSGKVLHVNVLHAWAVRLLTEVGLIAGGPDRTEAVNRLFWPLPDDDLAGLLAAAGHNHPADYPHTALATALAAAARPDRAFYVAHVTHAALAERCDTLANVLAVIAGIAQPWRAERILDHLDRAAVADPFPSKTWPQPFTEEDDPWQMWRRAAEPAMAPQWRNPPHCYHNAAVWPYVGGLHAVALARSGRPAAAGAVLARLAEANRVGEWGFHEWLHGLTGAPGGARLQTWNAGAFLWAVSEAET